jgi:hypothetical protein
MCATCTSHFNLLILTTLGQEFRLSKHIFSYKKTYSIIPLIHHPLVHTGARLSNILDYQTEHDHGLGSSDSITTGYGLDGPGIESRWGERFSTPVQTGPGAYPASCTMDTESYPGVKSGQGVVLTPHPFQCPGLKTEIYTFTLLKGLCGL